MSQTNKMLIDASHPEETRVVVLRNGRVEEFDYESAARKLLRGNIYLAKVTRVEPALQAAFVDYGGNRHGFLAFNEIHPDYYQIPIADRQALLDEEAAIEAEEEAEADARAERMEKRRGKSRRSGRNRRGNADNGLDDNGSDADADDDTLEAEGDNDQSFDADTDAETHTEVANAVEPDDVRPAHEAETDTNEDASADPVNASAATAEASPAESAANDADAPAQDDNGTDGSRDDETPPRTLAQATARDPSLSASPDNLDEVTEHAVAEHDSAPDVDSLFLDEPVLANTEASGDATAQEAGDEHAVDEDDAHARGHDEKTSADDDSDGDDEARDADDEGDETDDTDGPDDSDENGDNGEGDDAPEVVDTEEDALEEVAVRPRRSRRSYKIQEVIKRRQVLLIQVVKEERGNKGAALTTYLSLAGRYTVLMPNTARGGGISRKITQPQDRKRLKAIANELEVPEGMGLIIRTAGAARTKQEIRRDFEYLLRLWESVRELTLESTAPSLVYEEGNLIKRSIRDLYNKDVEEVVVAGDHAYRDAKEFMRMLMPSHAKNVIPYKEPEPLFTRYGIERQLNAMFSPQVTLKSGGYLVINQTEALVAVDVNSGRSTREFSIEETALHTNLEAADELARQLKLRDLAGLIVVDFIDMEEKRNNRKVEHRLKEALRHDRARIQIGRISHFGLLEMSRQRMRTGVLEGSTTQCVHCQGTGIIRSTESIALAVLRGLEDAVMGRQRGALVATTTATAALYILNNKRDFIIDMENRYGYPISVEASDKMVGANFAIERQAGSAPLPPVRRNDRTAVSMDWGFEDDSAEEPVEEASAAERDDAKERATGEETGRKRRRRRRGGRRGGEGAGDDSARFADDASGPVGEPGDDVEGDDTGVDAQDNGDDETTGEDGRGRSRRGRRRGRRGGRRNRERLAQQRQDGDGEAGDDENEANAIPGLGPQPSIAQSIIEITVPGHASSTDASKASGDDEDTGASAEAHDAAVDNDDPIQQRGPRRRRSSGGRRRTSASGEADVSWRADEDRGQPTEDGAATETSKSKEPPAAIGTDTEPASADASSAQVTTNDGADLASAHHEPSAETAPSVSQSPDEASEDATPQEGADLGDGSDGKAERSSRTEPVRDTPRVERVSVGSTSAGNDEEEAAPKRGWWQRRLLGQ